MNGVEKTKIAGGIRELAETELTDVGGGLNWSNVVKAVLLVTAAGAIGGPGATAMVASNIIQGGM